MQPYISPHLTQLISWKIHDKSIVATRATEWSGGFNKRLLSSDTLVLLLLEVSQCLTQRHLSSEDLQFYTDDSPSSLINYTQQIHCDTQAQCISKQWCVCRDFYMGDKLRHCLTGPGRKLEIFSTHSPWYFHISTWTCLKHSVSVCFCLFRCCDDAAVQGMCSANCVAVRREHKHSGEIEKRKCFDLNWLWRVDLEHVL